MLLYKYYSNRKKYNICQSAFEKYDLERDVEAGEKNEWQKMADDFRQQETSYPQFTEL